MYKWKSGSTPRVVYWVAFWLSALIIVTIIIPGILVKKIPTETSLIPLATPEAIAAGVLTTKAAVAEKQLMIPVYLSKKEVVETVPLEEYVRGVLAAEMPIAFELEALKAQAMAARTYMLRRITDQDFSEVPTRDAWVTDTVVHQAYINEDDLKSKWDNSTKEANMAKINRAVEETRGLILTYDNKPINATFFSTSNGYTENSEDYWPDKVPYLRSVPSPWDKKLSPRFEDTVTFSYSTLLQKLGLSSISSKKGSTMGISIIEQSAGHRIMKIRVGGKTFTGREIREKLGLASSQFNWKWKGSQLEITTYGYGHGVGMSQWGAQGMAKEGRTAADIVKYYYTGISIVQASEILAMK